MGAGQCRGAGLSEETRCEAPRGVSHVLPARMGELAARRARVRDAWLVAPTVAIVGADWAQVEPSCCMMISLALLGQIMAGASPSVPRCRCWKPTDGAERLCVVGGRRTR